jgi:hypothetical protein
VSDPTFDQAWRTFRNHVRFMRLAERLWFLPVVFAVAAFIAMATSEANAGSPIAFALLFALIAVVVVVRIIADMRLKTFLCPRCRRPFVALHLLQRAPLDTINRRFPCQNCGLPVGAVSANVDGSAA